MDTIFEINGSDAIPVRALPWLTAWAFGAYAVAEALAGDEYPWAAKIRAYRLLDGAIQNVSQHEWQNIILPRIHALYERYLDDVDFQRRATAELPAGVFVWREQWEQAYINSPDGPAGVHPDVLLKPENYDDDDLLCSLDANDLILNYQPNLLPDCVGLVTEGFAHGKQVPQAAPVVAVGASGGVEPDAGPVDKAPAHEPQAAGAGPRFSMTRAALISSHEHEWRNIRVDIAGASNNELKAAKAGSRGWYEDIAMEWARAKGRLNTPAKPANELAAAVHSMASVPSRKHILKG